MAKLDIPGWVTKQNASKTVTWHYWQPNATQRKAGWGQLKFGTNETAALTGCRARNEEIDIWKRGGSRPREIRKLLARGTIDALIDRYRCEYMNANGPGGRPNVADKTRESYATALKRISIWAGDQPLAYVTPARVRALRDAMMKPLAPKGQEGGGIGHAPAHNTLKMLRQLFAYAIKCDLVPTGQNPAINFDLGAPAPRRTVWKVAHESAFDTSARHKSFPSMALAREIALYTAQREGDLIKFTEHRFQPIELFDPVLIDRLGDDDGMVKGWIIDQHKTDMPLEIPFDAPLRAKVEAALRVNRARDRAATPPRLATHIIVNDKTGLPWKKRAFIDVYNQILAHAADASGQPEMRDLVWHDLRRTRVVRLRRQRMPKEQIATLTGTTEQSITAMLKAYGPIDATMTAGAIVASLDADIARDKAVADKKEQQQ